MSGEPRQLSFVVVDDPTQPICVTVFTHQNINDLKVAIHGYRNDIPVLEMRLWKVNIPITICDSTADKEALAKFVMDVHFPDPRSNDAYKEDSHLQLLDEGQDISEYWKTDPVPKTLNIIVQALLKERPAKRRRIKGDDLSDHTEVVRQTFAHFHKYFWGANRIQVFQKAGSSCSFVNFEHFDLGNFGLHPMKYLLIREEYQLAYDSILQDIQTKSGTPSSFLITGQPGIGKTLFLFYVLIRRLQEWEPVTLQINADSYLLFDKDGVHMHTQWAIPKGTWILSDSVHLVPCEAFLYSQGHLIHTSSPASRRWKDWTKQLCAKFYVMDIWSQEEFKSLLTISNHDIRRGIGLFLKYGSNVRAIVDILEVPSKEDSYLYSVQRTAARIAQETNIILLDLANLDFSSNVTMVRPNNLVTRLPVLVLPTRFLVETLGLALAQLAVAQQQNFFTTLSYHPSLRSAAGLLFENFAHVILSDPTRKPVQTSSSNNGKPSIPTPNRMKVGSNELRHVERPFDFYWRPESDFPGLDAVIRVGQIVWGLQFTPSTRQGSASEGLSKAYEFMNHTKNTKWCLGIVGPCVSAAESVERCQRLTGKWEKMPVYAIELPFGIMKQDRLRMALEEGAGNLPILGESSDLCAVEC